MLQPVRGGRSRYVLALLLATAITLLTLDFRGFAPLEKAQSQIREVIEPVAGTFAGAVRPIRSTWHGIADYDKVKDDNARLRAELDSFKSSSVGERNAQQMLDDLLAQASIASPGATEKVLARVVSGPASNFENTIRIDKGSDDGLTIGMPVVTAAGLVGRVAEVTRTRSVVQLADSRGFGVGVRLVGASAPVTFLLRGQGPGKPLLVQGDVSSGVAVVDGDSVVTSGLDQSVFPPELLVGRVVGTGRTSLPPPPTTTTSPSPVTKEAGSATNPAEGSAPKISATPPTTLAPLETLKTRPLEGIKVELFVQPRSLAFVTVLLWKPVP